MSKNVLDNYGISSMSPLAQKVIRVFGCLVSLWFLIVFSFEKDLSVMWAFGLVGIGLLSLWLYSRPDIRYYTPLFFTVFYFIGYLLYLTYILLYKEDIPKTGWNSIGRFKFVDSHFLPFAFVVFSGMAGVFIAFFIARLLFRKRSCALISKDIRPENLSANILCILILAWFIFSVFLVLIMWSLGIGKTGLANETQLPFKLNGMLYFMKKIFIPFCGILFLDICLRLKNKKLASQVVILLLVIGFLGALGGLSRGVFAFTIFPPILFLLFTSRKGNLSLKLFCKFSLFSVAALVIVVFLVQLLRNAGFSGQDVAVTKSVAIIKETGDMDFFKKLSSKLPVIAAGRVGGVWQLMSISSSRYKNKEAPVKVFFGDKALNKEICLSVYGFNPKITKKLAFGTSYGLWGQMFLGKNYYSVFIGTFLITAVIILFEELFVRRGIRSAALFFSILLGFELWDSPRIFTLSRYVILLFLCYFVMRVILKGIDKQYYKTHAVVSL